MAPERAAGEGVWRLALAAVCGFAIVSTAAPAEPMLRTIHPVSPDHLSHVVTGRCGNLQVELSYVVPPYSDSIVFADVLMNGVPVEGSASALSSALGDDFLLNLTLMNCLSKDGESPRAKLLMTILHVEQPSGEQRLSARTFELFDGKIEPR